MEIDDWRFLEAAEGWIELGQFAEAVEELELVSPAVREHPKSLEVCWRIYWHHGRWGECWNIARAILTQVPGDAMGVILLAEATNRLQGPQEAFEVLFRATVTVKDSATIWYNLACYSALLGNFSEARCNLGMAIELADAHSPERGRFYRRLAEEDLDLKPLGEIGWPLRYAETRLEGCPAAFGGGRDGR